MVPYFAQVGEKDAPMLAFLMHGVLGAGHNLRSLAKRITEVRPDYRFLLIDLRGHGRSSGATPPHTIEACVDDLFDLCRALGHAPQTVLGHSLGGKVALAYGRRVLSSPPAELSSLTLRQIWTLDSDPGAQRPAEDHQVRVVLSALLSSQGPFASRADALAALERAGLSPGLSQWLATNLDRQEDGLVWKLELKNIEQLLEDYFSLDLWPFLEGDAQLGRVRFDLLLAENSDRFTGHMKERALSLRNGDQFQVHLLPRSGHWVHVDNPEGLVEILAANLVGPVK